MEFLVFNEEHYIKTQELELNTVDDKLTSVSEIEAITFISEKHPNPVHVITKLSLIKHKENLFYNKNSGEFIYIVGSDKWKASKLVSMMNQSKKRHYYPHITLNYSANFYTSQISQTTVKKADEYNYFTNRLNYSFGLEFETSEGIIPQTLCFTNGLIPLRDGSISGYEYATIVLGKTYGMKILKNQLNILKKYTEFNKECALHIHFGKLPISLPYAFILFKLCKELEPQILSHVPKYSFNTNKYKANNKNYCNKLPENITTMGDMMNYFSEIAETDEDYDYNLDNWRDICLTENHPQDRSRNHKWQIHSRYHWVNFTNLLFYQSHKTVEFRFLRPTYNYTKIATWIYIFNAILDTAKIIYNSGDIKTALDEDNLTKFYQIVNKSIKNISMLDILSIIYPDGIYTMSTAWEKLKQEVDVQHKLFDFAGEHAELDDCFFNYIIK